MTRLRGALCWGLGALALCLPGCSPQNTAQGGFLGYFEDPELADQVVLDQPVTIAAEGGTLEIIPRARRGPRGRVIRYSVSLISGGGWRLDEDDEFRALLSERLSPVPDEIYAIVLPGLKYSQAQFERTRSIQEFWEFLESREAPGYSLEEIRQLLPESYSQKLDEPVTQSRTFVLDWPEDERDLTLGFVYDPEKQAAILRSHGLVYRVRPTAPPGNEDQPRSHGDTK